MRICSIGECMVELSHDINNRYILSYAGDTANTAIYLSRLGAHSAYITSVGNDKLSKKMISFLNKENIFTDNVHINKNSSLGLYLINNEKNGEKNFFYWRDNSAPKTYFENINLKLLLKKMSNYDAVYFTGITLSIYNQTNINLFYKFLSSLKKNGITIYFDFNVRLKNWQNKKIALKQITRFLKISNICLLTEEDLDNLGIKNYEKFIFSNFKNKLIILRSRNGNILVYDKQNLSTFNFVFKRKVKDTTGCGDAFNACFLFYYFNNFKIKDCLRIAHKLGKDVANVKGAILKKENFKLARYGL